MRIGEKEKTNKFIVYSIYGRQTHIVVNNYGVCFSCNNNGVVFSDFESANKATTSHFNRIAEVQELIEISSYKCFYKH